MESMESSIHTLFISSDIDHNKLRPLLRHLKPVCDRAKIALFHPSELPVGVKVKDASDQALARAAVVLLILTPEYLNSAEHRSRIKGYLERFTQGRSIPIRWAHVTDAALENAGLKDLLLLPRSSDSVAAASDQEAILVQIADEIGKVLEALPRPLRAAPQSPVLRTQRPGIPAKEYRALLSTAADAAKQLQTLGEQLRLQTATTRATRLRKELLNNLYRVVITGKSRAGKSTLINALLGRELCPSNRKRTTVVPLNVRPAAEESAWVSFLDGREALKLGAPLSAELLRPYADGTHNPTNDRRVARIDVYLPDDVLAMGVSYTDIPGFDDPNASVLEQANAQIDAAHALVLVIDVSPYDSGGLSLDQWTIKLLKTAQECSKPVFLVGNKADKLDESQQTEVRDLIESDCRQEGIPAPQLFLLSAKLAAEKKAAPPFVAFYEALWERLWATEDIGIRRLQAVFRQLVMGSQEIAALFQVRDQQEERRAALRKKLEDCKAACKSLQEETLNCFDESLKLLPERLTGLRTTLDSIIDRHCQAMPAGAGLPTASRLLKDLMKPMQQATDAMLKDLERSMHQMVNRLQAKSSARFDEIIDAVGAGAQHRQLLLKLPDLRANVNQLRADDGHEIALAAVGVLAGGFVGIAVSAFFGPVAGVAAGGLAMSAVGAGLAAARPGSVQELRKTCMERLDEGLIQMERELVDSHNQACTQVADQLGNGMTPFINELLTCLDNIRPPTAEERRFHAAFEKTSHESLALLSQTLTS